MLGCPHLAVTAARFFMPRTWAKKRKDNAGVGAHALTVQTNSMWPFRSHGITLQGGDNGV